jgi:hypothetical protein
MDLNDSCQEKLEFAKKVVVALVKSPLYNDTLVNLDQELNDFFKTERVLALNDFFFIKNIYNPSKSTMSPPHLSYSPCSLGYFCFKEF